MIRHLFSIVSLIALWLVLSFCSSCTYITKHVTGTKPSETPATLKVQNDPVKAPALEEPRTLTYYARQIVLDLTNNLNEEDFVREQYPVVVSILSNTNRKHKDCNFGVALTDCLIASLQQEGYWLADVPTHTNTDKDDNIFAPRDGDHIVLERLDLHATLVGTYSVGYNEIIVNARLVDALDGSILSTSSRQIPVDANISYLLAEKAAHNHILDNSSGLTTVSWNHSEGSVTVPVLERPSIRGSRLAAGR